MKIPRDLKPQHKIDLRTCGPDDVLVIMAPDNGGRRNATFKDGCIRVAQWERDKPEPLNWAWVEPSGCRLAFHADGHAYGVADYVIAIRRKKNPARLERIASAKKKGKRKVVKAASMGIETVTIRPTCHGSTSPISIHPPLMSATDRSKQVGGSHYKDRRIQPWDIILEYGLDYWEGNAVKYILRRKTDRLEDLKKARHYLDECIRQREAKS